MAKEPGDRITAKQALDSSWLRPVTRDEIASDADWESPLLSCKDSELIVSGPGDEPDPEKAVLALDRHDEHAKGHQHVPVSSDQSLAEKRRFTYKQAQERYERHRGKIDLVEFSRNFKLATPVPKHLVPLLSKNGNLQHPELQQQVLQLQQELQQQHPELQQQELQQQQELRQQARQSKIYVKVVQSFRPRWTNVGQGGIQQYKDCRDRPFVTS